LMERVAADPHAADDLDELLDPGRKRAV
jgi:hypothetical protein